MTHTIGHWPNASLWQESSAFTRKRPQLQPLAFWLTLCSFVVYATSAIYIIGIPEMILEFKLDEQQVLLGLSLYVLACQYVSMCFSTSPLTLFSRWVGTNALGAIERA